MEASNFDNTPMAFRRRTPYRPFTVVLVNGDRFEVDHQKALAVRDGGGVRRTWRRADMIDVELVDESWCGRLPAALAARLHELIDKPNG